MHQVMPVANCAKWLSLVLPAPVIGALALMPFSGQNWLGSHVHAQAPSPDMSLLVKGGTPKGPDGCTTKGVSGNNCGIPVGTWFGVSVQINSIAGLPDGDEGGKAGYTGIHVRLNYDDALGAKGNRSGITELGPDGDPFWPDCDDTTRTEDKADKTDGTASYAAGCDIDPAKDESTYLGVIMEQTYFCGTLGKHTITLKHGTSDSYIVDDTGNAVLDGSGTESIVVECQELEAKQPEIINIEKVDKSEQGLHLAGSCWQVYVEAMNPDTGQIDNLPADVVSDNNAVSECAPLIFIEDLSDGDPADGFISITIPGDARARWGDIWGVQEVRAPDGYNINDANKYECDLSLGKCALIVKNEAKPCPDFDGDTLCDEVDPDDDNDGCTDVAELQPKSEAATGGGRDPHYYWDFMDMWVNKQKDRRVNIIDVGAIVQRFFTAGDPGADPLDPPQDLTSYHVSADRSPPIGANPWNAGPPDGAINIIEIGLAVAQFGHNCN